MRRIPWLCAVAVLAGCSADGTVIPQPHALYGPAAATTLTPYPSNRYATPDATTATGLRVAIDATTTADPLVSTIASTVATLDTLDGFSTLGGVATSFTDDLDPTTFTRAPADYAAPGAPMALVDVDPSSPESGHAVGLVPRYLSSNDDPDATDPEFTLIAEPATPLRPKTLYAFVLTDRIATTAGNALVATEDTNALLTGTGRATTARASARRSPSCRRRWVSIPRTSFSPRSSRPRPCTTRSSEWPRTAALRLRRRSPTRW
jgi:hypothetical protein